jgi:hypothetical protein
MPINWNVILNRIRDGKCTPFLGAGACYGVLPLGGDVAREWAKKYSYPLADTDNLPRVAQFVAIEEGDQMAPKDELARRFKLAPPPDFTQDNEPHAVLADLPLPLYMTTNYDDFMVRALDRLPNKKPRKEMCRWNKFTRETLGTPTVFDAERDYQATVDNPVVFHLHGYADVSESLVLTEDDYLDFLVSISKDSHLIPPRIQQAFSGTSLLFLGYSLADLNFRVIFRNLVGYMEKSMKRKHLAVQLAPAGLSDEQKEKAQSYLDNYFSGLDVTVYWGTCREFVAELSRKWKEFNNAQ